MFQSAGHLPEVRYRCKACLREFNKPNRVRSHQEASDVAPSSRRPGKGTFTAVKSRCPGGGIDKVVTFLPASSANSSRAPRTVVTVWELPAGTDSGGSAGQSREAVAASAWTDGGGSAGQSREAVVPGSDGEGRSQPVDSLCHLLDETAEEEDDVGPGADGLEHAVDQMFILVCEQQACSHRSPCLAFDPETSDVRGLRGWPSLSQALFEAPKCAAQTRPTLNTSESLLHQYIAQHQLTTLQINGLLVWVQNPDFMRRDVAFQSAVGYRLRVDRAVASGLRQVCLRSEAESRMDGTNDMTMWYQPVEDIITDMVQSHKYASRMNWTFRRTVDEQSGHRVFTSLADSLWFEGVCGQIQSTLGHHTHVVPVVVGSDGTQTRKRAGAHPVYISIGTLDADMRRSTEAWVLSAFIPPLLSRGG